MSILMLFQILYLVLYISPGNFQEFDSHSITGSSIIQDETNTPLHTIPIILKRKVGLKSRKMCKAYCRKPGLNTEDDDSMDPLIHGGRISPEKLFPHMAAISYGPPNDMKWICGGSLISENFVLTAAHCAKQRIKSDSSYWVLLGSLTLPIHGNTYGPNYQLIAVSEPIRHPDYRAKYIYNDIALFRLKDKVKFNDYIRPACLPIYDIKQQTAVASGWGITHFHDSSNNNVLRDVTLNILTPEDCPSNTRMPRGTNNFSQICAGELKGGKDTCLGDSGGPLQLQEGECGTTIIGIVSFGTQFCGSQNSPGLYTRVIHFLGWIEDTVWPPTDRETIILN